MKSKWAGPCLSDSSPVRNEDDEKSKCVYCYGLLFVVSLVYLTHPTLPTVQAPAWNYVTEAFSGNPDVSFGDVNLEDSPSLRMGHNAGHDGWPTIRYYNGETGITGGDYKRKTSAQVCNELKIEDNMIAYVETAAMTTMCLTDETGCDDSELSFMAMMKDKGVEAQRKALVAISDKNAMDEIAGMLDENLRGDLLRFLGQRRKIMHRLLEEKGEVIDDVDHDEL